MITAHLGGGVAGHVAGDDKEGAHPHVDLAQRAGQGLVVSSMH